MRLSYIEKKDYKNALQYQHIEASTRAEILSQENWSKITELDKKYQTEQQEKEIELQKTLLDLKNAEVNKRNIIIACLLITCIIIIIGIIYIQRNNAKLKEANKKIANQNEEIHSQSEKLKATNSKLVELDHFKEGMTGMIVHDLKNPLSSILGNELSYETKKAAQQMLTMVMNILDVQKLESTEMKLSFANVHLFTLATDATQEVAYLSERKSIQILNIIPKELYINADYEIIKRVFINLLTNALKYSPNNESITLYTDNNQQGFENHVGLFTDFVKICISDRGIGIPQTQLIKVFDKFAQIEARSIGKLRSTGLGLTFCKLAVEAHKGKIGVESEIEHGSTFWFLLPKGLNSETVTTDNNQENETISGAINLNESDIKYLMPFCTELQQYEVFEFSKIIEIIDRINIEENSNVENWKRILENAVRACNENKYNHLILNKLKNA